MEIRYQSVEQLREDHGWTISLVYERDEKGEPWALGYRASGKNYFEAIENLKRCAERCMRTIRDPNERKCVFGVESQLMENGQILVMGTLGTYTIDEKGNPIRRSI